MPDFTATFYITYIIQAGGALLTAAVFRSFHRYYGKTYLLHFQWSWLALSVFLACGALAILFNDVLPPTSPYRILPATVGSVAGYLQLAWLLFGTYELALGSEVPREASRRVLVVVASLGFVASLLFAWDPAAGSTRFMLREGARSLSAGIAFLIASYGIWRSHGKDKRLGPRLVASAFCVYGLEQIHLFGIDTMSILRESSFSYSSYLGLIDFLLQFMMALGMVIWLLEEQQKIAEDAAAHIEHLAYHDNLTGLPNRQLFLDRLNLSMAHANRGGHHLAVVFLDLDRFKVINDSLGHSVGDQILRVVAHRLRHSLREGDTVTRLGGDEFTILLPQVKVVEDAIVVARKLRETVKDPITLDGRQLFVTPSIGISIYPNDGIDAGALLRNADAAMYRAKAEGRDSFRLYTPAMNVKALEQLALENSLRLAITNDELEVYFQPIVEMESGRIAAVESLLRWNHPELGLLGPANFISLAEATGLIVPIGERMMRESCAQVKTWQERGLPHLRAACNLSVRQLQQPDFVATVSEILQETGLSASSLDLEITESIAMQSMDGTVDRLRELNALGVRISIDDFGTGYSSLHALRLFPVDALKIDSAFVHDTTAEAGDTGIAVAVIALAHSLGLSVIAEGVETSAQLEFLRERQCHAWQGRLHSAPSSATECERVLFRQPGGLRGLSAVLPPIKDRQKV